MATHMSGRPLGEKARVKFIRDMNHPSNIRIKSARGNIVLDERRDARIAAAFIRGVPIKGKTTTRRAYLAYQAASAFTTTERFAQALSRMRVLNPENGRCHLLCNHGKFR